MRRHIAPRAFEELPMRSVSRLSSSSSTIGTGDALDRLEQDHRQVETLFAQASLSPGVTRARTVRLITHALTVHARLEEEVIYPAIADALGAGRSLVDKAVAEHDEMKGLIARLERTDPSDVEVLDDLRALHLLVQQHVAVEEGEVFPVFRARASAAEMDGLTRKADRARGAAPSPPAEDGNGHAEARPSRNEATKAAVTTASGRKPAGPASRKAASPRSTPAKATKAKKATGTRKGAS
jgi:hemerythrin superfamily protein